MSLQFIEYGRIRLLDRTKLSVVYWDTSVPGTGPWPALPQNVPNSEQWMPVPLNQVALNRGMGALPGIGHALLRVWLMTGTPTNTNDVPNLGAAFRAPGAADIAAGDWACQAHGKQERQAHEIWVPLDSMNRFEYAATRNNCAGCSYGINIEWLGYAYNAI